MEIIKRTIVLTPGPTTTTYSVKYAQIVPDICPREWEITNLIRNIRSDLVSIAEGNDEYTAILFMGSGTAVIDSVINSVVPIGKKILIVNNGAYGERMVKIAQTYCIDFVELAFPWTETPDIDLIEKTLKNDPQISHLAMVHHETTTGLLNPLEEIAVIAQSFNIVLIVDAVSSFAGVPIDIKSRKIGYLASTSCKCLQGMAGISFVICNKNEVQKLSQSPPRSFYLDLFQQYKFLEEKNETRFTFSPQLLYSLDKAISEFKAEGIEGRSNRYYKNWEVLTEGLQTLGFKLLLEKEKQSRLLTSIIEPNHVNYNFSDMHDLLYADGFTIYPGKINSLKTFRVANVGAINHFDIQAFLLTLEEAMEAMDLKIPLYTT